MKRLAMIAGLLVACGGEPKPAETPAAPALSDSPTAKVEAAPASSADVSRGRALLNEGKLPEARTALESAIKKSPKQADAHYFLALTLERLGDKATALKEYQAALELSPDLVEAAANLVAMLTEAQRFDEAITVAKKTLAKNARSAELQLNYAFALAGKDDVEGATKAFEEATKIAPSDARLYLAYGEQLGKWKKRDEAVAKLKQGLAVAGDDAAMVGSIAFALRTERAAPECVAAFDKAIALKDNADFRTNRALCKLASKDKAGATADLKEATSKEPSFAVAHYWYGLLLHEDGKFGDGAKEYEAYLKLAPTGPLSKAAEAKLKLAKDKKKPPAPPEKK